MIPRRLRVGQGARLGLLTVSLLLPSACSGDSSVDFDPVNPGSAGSGASDAGTGASAGSNSAGSKSDGGNSQAGQTNQAGKAGTDAGGTKNQAGTDAGGNAGKGGTDGTGSDNGGKAGMGGTGAGGGGAAGMSGGGMSGAGSGGGGAAGTGGGGAAGMAGGGASGAGAGGGGAAGMGGEGGSAGGAAGCTTGMYENSLYYFCGAVDSAPLAEQKCESLGMALAVVGSAGENAFIASKIKGSSWLGGSDQAQEGDWRWLDDTLFTQNKKPIEGVYSNWIAMQPNDNGPMGAHENCLVITPAGPAATAGQWNDLSCDLAGNRIACEGPQK